MIEKYVIVTERDCPDWMESSGPMVMETPLFSASLSETLERARFLNGKYGQVMICKLEPVGSPEEILAGESPAGLDRPAQGIPDGVAS